jgi:1-aminocyclopropane-1-carboxylate deaminase
MKPVSPENIRVDNIRLPVLAHKNISLSVLRLDLIHPVISGNKWFKLKNYLPHAKEKGMTTIATFGGAYSNHIIATAAACALHGFRSIGIIRGEAVAGLSHTLKFAKSLGMELFFISREAYREKKIPREIEAMGKLYIIPEGGYGEKGAQGASDIAEFFEQALYTDIVCAAGTTTMLAGLVKSGLPFQKFTAISALKNRFSMEDELKALLSDQEKKRNFRIVHAYHFGGYAKYDQQLLDFMNDFFTYANIPTDFVYTGKMFFGICDLAAKDFFEPGSRILAIHSGGLQGNLSLPSGSLIF